MLVQPEVMEKLFSAAIVAVIALDCKLNLYSLSFWADPKEMPHQVHNKNNSLMYKEE